MAFGKRLASWALLLLSHRVLEPQISLIIIAFEIASALKGLRITAQGQPSLGEATLGYGDQIGKQCQRFAAVCRLPAASSQRSASRLRTTAPTTTINTLNRVNRRHTRNIACVHHSLPLRHPRQPDRSLCRQRIGRLTLLRTNQQPLIHQRRRHLTHPLHQRPPFTAELPRRL